MLKLLNKLLNKNILILMDLKKNWHLIIDNISKPMNLYEKNNKLILEIIIPRGLNLDFLTQKNRILKQINFYLVKNIISDIRFYSEITS